MGHRQGGVQSLSVHVLPRAGMTSGLKVGNIQGSEGGIGALTAAPQVANYLLRDTDLLLQLVHGLRPKVF